MEFEIASADELALQDAELTALLNRVYVDVGYTNREEAHTLFAPDNVRRRGMLLVAREKETSVLAGMIILVPFDSPACRRAGEDEAELHLLAVAEKFRGCGLGRMLVETAIVKANQLGYAKLLLWTQPSMTVAQKLYTSTGFIQVGSFENNGRPFKLYELSLAV